MKGENTVFIIEDYHCTNPVFVEILANLVSGSGLPDFFSQDEIDKTNKALTEQMSLQGWTDGSPNCFLLSRKLNLCSRTKPIITVKAQFGIPSNIFKGYRKYDFDLKV